MYCVRMDISRETAALVQAALDVAERTPLAVSEHTGIPRTTLLRRLTGTSPFTVAELEMIADFLGVSLLSLIPDTDTRPGNAA